MRCPIDFMRKLVFLIFIIYMNINALDLKAQFRVEGKPLSFSEMVLHEEPQLIRLDPPDMNRIIKEDVLDEASGNPPRIATLLPVSISPDNSGTWDLIPDIGKIWRVQIKVSGAEALGLYFKDLALPGKSTLHIYNERRSQLLGAYTSFNNRDGGAFAIEYLFGDNLIIEYFEPEGCQESLQMEISEVAYFYRGVNNYGARGFGDSGPCEVNINCSPEGDSWKDEKKGIVRIQCRVGGSVFWCTGTLVNNTNLDKTPYLLTADHCAYKFYKYATPEDLEDWIFYFDFEGPACDNPTQSPQLKSLTGAVKIASGGNHGEDGSDFYLVRLLQDIPSGYTVYFNGWNAVNEVVSEGVTIHHPEGDIKKISTFATPLISTGWQGNALQSHWQVTWAETANGFGVTEPGSSGSPLFDNNGRVIGTLTGGQASCSQPTLPDYYGKFSYHWMSNGVNDTLQLRPWLDPENTGQLSLGGLEVTVPDTITKKTDFVQLFPNPVSGTLYIKRLDSLPDDLLVEIFDFAGRPAGSFNISGLNKGETYPFHVEHFSNGMYFIRIIEESNISLHKIILN